MNCQQFQETLLQWIDEELHGDAARAAAEHESACADCATGAASERAFEARTRVALTSGTPAIDVAAMLREAHARADADPATEPGTRPHPAGRLLRLRRMVTNIAGVAAVFVGLAWFNCVPPFECSYLQAVERAAYEPADVVTGATGGAEDVAAKAYRACVKPPADLRGYARQGVAEGVGVDYRVGAPAVRARYSGDGGSVVVVWCEQIGRRPSFRRLEDRQGDEWWIAEENERTLVSYMCPATNSLVTVSGALPEAELLAMASELRKAAHE